ncbi:PAS domain S-box protein [Granulicella sp. WH15]|uniref:PAS domain-containing sensor histidine kinase n=1 Tax=Granulicella sp. WH15 TaxID=2602070 RepID=UPI001366B93A|nr:PAS domain-containing sensor histidine kinase [Granulicella sp. WH15]QHN05163.1 PAS domain S-box protein [Granulicella sp. WH15]
MIRTAPPNPSSGLHLSGDAPRPASKALLDLIPNPILCLDSNLRLTYANQAAHRLGHLLPESAETAFGAHFEAACHEVLADGPSRSFEYLDRPSRQWFSVLIQRHENGLLLHYQELRQEPEQESGPQPPEHRRLETSSHQLWQVFEATPDGIALIDHNWLFSFANRRARELLLHDSILGLNLFDLFPGYMQASCGVACRVTMEQRVATEFEVFHPAPFNHWLKVQARPFEDGILLFFSDITERKHNEEALAASEQRYRVLADLNPQALWAGSPEGAIIYANQGLLDYLGLTLKELEGRGWPDVLDARDRTATIDAWTRAVSTGDHFDVEARLRRVSDRSYRWWNLRALPVRDESGVITSWLGVGQETHDMKTAAEALRAEQQETERKRLQLETVYRTAPIGLSLIDPAEFRYLRINEREAENLGLTESEVIGRTISEVMPIPGLIDLFHQVALGIPVKDHLLEGELPVGRGESRSAGSSDRHAERRAWTVNYYPVYGPSGAIEAISTAAVEITNQRRSEAALIQSEKLAAVGRLASSISHEINNPLEAVTNLLYLIGLAPDLSPDNQVYIRMAQSELSRVSQIATQTLRFHRQAIAPTPVTAGELVGAVLDLYQGRLANSGIKVDARYDTEVPILCFENDIRQVLNNLIANAIDAMRAGGRLVLRAHASQGTQGESGIRITIADTGHGMEPKTLARIFEPFYTTKDLNGTGLGLWISSGIVERHQGRLDVRSTTHPIHHGTVFTLFLPLEHRPAE